MENKLQELTQKLYNEGLSKGKEEAEKLVADAKTQAEKIVNDAKAQAQQLLQEAEQRAEELRKNTMNELTLASRQTLGTLKQQIEKLVILQGVAPAVKRVNADPQFIKEMLLKVAGNWSVNSADRIDLTAVLPAETQAAFQQMIEEVAKSNFADGLEITFDSKVKSGFKIGPRDGAYYISFSDADFDALLRQYLRPQVAKMLFAEE